MNPSNRRRQYRVGELAKWKIRVEIVLDSHVAEATLIDVSFNGAGIWIGRKLDPGLALEQRIFLRFISPHIGEPIKTVATVNFRATDGAGTRYGLGFVNARHIQEQVPPKMIGLFNRRRSFRVVPDSSEPINAVVHGQDGELVAELPVISLSATGCALFAKLRDQQVLKRGDAFILSFSLPEETTPCRFVGQIRYGMPWQSGVRYGVEFHNDGSRAFQQLQRLLMDYVMVQQRKMLKMRASAE